MIIMIIIIAKMSIKHCYDELCI